MVYGELINMVQSVHTVMFNKERVNPMEKELGVTKAREQFGELVEQVQYQGDAIVISRNGKPAAAIVPIEVYEGWKRQRKEFFDMIRQMAQQANLEPGEANQLAVEAVIKERKPEL